MHLCVCVCVFLKKRERGKNMKWDWRCSFPMRRWGSTRNLYFSLPLSSPLAILSLPLFHSLFLFPPSSLTLQNPHYLTSYGPFGSRRRTKWEAPLRLGCVLHKCLCQNQPHAPWSKAKTRHALILFVSLLCAPLILIISSHTISLQFHFSHFSLFFFENASTYVEWTSTFHWIVNFLFRNFFPEKMKIQSLSCFMQNYSFLCVFFQLENAILMLALYENIPRFYERYFIICIVRAWKTSKNRCD